MTQTTIRLTVNGRVHDVAAAPDTALLYVLRNDLELNGPKFGCGLGECGACAVMIDGMAARACVIPISGCVGRDIVTLEGLGSRDHPDPVQAACLGEQARRGGAQHGVRHRNVVLHSARDGQPFGPSGRAGGDLSAFLERYGGTS